MIADLEQIFGGEVELIEDIRRRDHDFGIELLERFARPLPSGEPWLWVCAHARLKTPTVSGAFVPQGREYMRELINNVNVPELREITECMGTGNGKTIIAVLRWLWALHHDPFSGLWINPSKEGSGGARQFANGILIPTIEATECFREKLPVGEERHNISGLKVKFGGNDIDLVGGNSPTQLAAKRCNRVHLDEQDKLKEKLGREGSADQLAMERTKQVANPQISRGSTPTLESFGIWPHLMRSDLRRRFLPCPHCNPQRDADLAASQGAPIPAGGEHGTAAACRGWFVLVKDERFTMLPTKFAEGGGFSAGTQIPMACLRWDKEAKRKDGVWDMDRVIRSARFECPWCGGHVRDEHRVWMDLHGRWVRTRGALHHAGYHLPSFYAPQVDFDSSIGGMAKKFLDNHEAGNIQGVINSDYAEVYVSQEFGEGSVLEVTSGNFSTGEWTALMTCDFQRNWPFIWFVVQRWSSFKLHPPFPLTDGKPNFADDLKKNPAVAALCEKIVAGHEGGWLVLAEVLRFDARTGEFPMLDFLAGKGIVGEKLVRIFRDVCNANTVDLGRWIYGEMGLRMPKGGDAEVIGSGHCELSGDDAWQELRERQMEFKVGENLRRFGLHANRAVMVDSGYMEEHNPEVLRKCYESGATGRFEWYDPMAKKFTRFKVHQFCRPVPVDCWVPFKGYPIRQGGRWKVGGIPSSTHWAPDDPFKGLMDAGKKTIAVLEAASEHYFRRWVEKRARQKEVREAMAAGKSYRGNVWNVSNDCKFYGHQCQRREDLEAQLNTKGINSQGEIWERGTGGGGKRRHPDHLLDCASQMQEALAEAMGFYSYDQTVSGLNGGKENGK